MMIGNFFRKPRDSKFSADLTSAWLETKDKGQISTVLFQYYGLLIRYEDVISTYQPSFFFTSTSSILSSNLVICGMAEEGRSSKFSIVAPVVLRTLLKKGDFLSVKLAMRRLRVRKLNMHDQSGVEAPWYIKGTAVPSLLLASLPVHQYESGT